MAAARLENVVKANQIRLNVHIRVGDGIAHARLRRQVDDDGRGICGEDALHRLAVGDAAAHKVPRRLGMRRRQPFNLGEAVFLDGHIIVVVHIVQPDNGRSARAAEQLHHQVCADKTGSAGDKDGLILQSDIRR